MLRWLGDDGKWVTIEEMADKAKNEDPRLNSPRETVTDVAAKLFRKWGKTLGIEKKNEIVNRSTRRGDTGCRVFYRRKPT